MKNYSVYINIMSLTFICCPKPFLPQFKDIQNNAIVSWTKLKSVNKIIICGDDEGVEDYTMELISLNTNKIEYVKNIEKNSYGTPLVNCLFKLGADKSSGYVCYINADIILLQDFDETFQAFINQYPKQKDFLLIGRRWDWHHPIPIDFTKDDWQTVVSEKAKADGEWHAITGIDYFIHSRTTYPTIPAFALGRFIWDNWLVGNAQGKKNVMTVDLTNTVLCIHQNCPWFMNKNLVNTTDKKKALQGPEALINKKLGGNIKGRNIKTGTSFKSIKGAKGVIKFVKKDPPRIKIILK